MSENENPPSKQTSSVPLKKETVRVTLKAADAPAAPSAPSAPVRPPSPTMPPTATVPGAPRPAPAPTIPLRPAGAPTMGGAPAPAPTIPLRPAGAPTVGGAPAPAPTIPLRPAGSPTLPGGVPAAGPTIALPKATVQLQPPNALPGTSPTVASFSTVVADDEEEGSEKIVNILSIATLIAALVVLVFQISTASTWVNAPDKPEENQGWGQLFSSDS